MATIYVADPAKRDDERLAVLVQEMRIEADKAAIKAEKGRQRMKKAVARMRINREL